MYKKNKLERIITPQIAEAGNEVIRMTKANGYEYGIGISSSGIILKFITSYDPKEISLSEEYMKSLNGGSFVHNHNEGFSLSIEDFKVAYKGKFEIYARVIQSSQKKSQGFYCIRNAHKHNLYKVIKLFNKHLKLEENRLIIKAKKGVNINCSKDYKNVEHKVWKKIRKRMHIDYFWIGIEDEN